MEYFVLRRFSFSAKLGKDARRSRSAKYIDHYSGAPIAEKKGNVKVSKNRNCGYLNLVTGDALFNEHR